MVVVVSSGVLKCPKYINRESKKSVNEHLYVRVAHLQNQVAPKSLNSKAKGETKA